jgi:hypothetical protein
MGLPAGIYFYVVNLLDLGFEFQGFIYLARWFGCWVLGFGFEKFRV